MSINVFYSNFTKKTSINKIHTFLKESYKNYKTKVFFATIDLSWVILLDEDNLL